MKRPDPPDTAPDERPEPEPDAGVGPPRSASGSPSEMVSGLIQSGQKAPLTGKARSRANLTGHGNDHVLASRAKVDALASEAQRGSRSHLDELERIGFDKREKAYVRVRALEAVARLKAAQPESQRDREIPATVESWMAGLLAEERDMQRARGECPDCRGALVEPPACRAAHGNGVLTSDIGGTIPQEGD